ncbi:MAG TPA: NAD(P)/FAD-dependent oxidoreductase [Chloroflexota bacterium]
MPTQPIVVVGGGPAGSTTALLLAQRGAQVVLLDGARFPRRKACAEYISPGGARLLAELGLDLTGHGRRLRGMEIYGPSGACHAVKYSDPDGQARLGLSIDRFVLDAALLNLARAHGVEVREGCRVSGVVTDQRRVTGVRLMDSNVVKAELVIGADGIHSVVARTAGPPLGTYWPRRLGLVAHYRGVPWPEPFGQLRVGHSGYVGVAPLDDDGLVTVGLVTPLTKRPATFDAALADYPPLVRRLAAGQRLEPLLGIGPLARRVRACQGPGYLLVGDAAGFFDPFTGEGIYRALRGAQLAATAIADDVDYAQLRRRAFATKERLTMVIQLFVQSPPLLELALRRFQRRPVLARQLGNVLGDLEPARLSLVWHLLRP